MDTDIKVGLVAILWACHGQLSRTKQAFLANLLESCIYMVQDIEQKFSSQDAEMHNLREQVNSYKQVDTYREVTNERIGKAAQYFSNSGRTTWTAFAELMAFSVESKTQLTFWKSANYILSQCHMDKLILSCQWFIRGNVINTIKHLREATGISLKEAEDIVEDMYASIPPATF